MSRQWCVVQSYGDGAGVKKTFGPYATADQARGNVAFLKELFSEDWALYEVVSLWGLDLDAEQPAPEVSPLIEAWERRARR